MADDKNKTASKGAAKPSSSPDVKAKPPASAARSSTGGPSASPAGRQQAESLGFLAMTAGILIALNVLGMFLFTRLDATRNRAFSLASGSQRVVSDLDEDLTITAYFTANLPAQFATTERAVRDLLAEYESASGGRVHVRFVSPDSDDEREEAERAGIQLVQHRHLENDAFSIVEGYRGIVFEYLGNREVIAVVQSSEGLEYEITSTIRELTGEDMVLGILSGHEGPTPTKGLSALERMLPSYDIQEVSATEAIDPEMRALLIIEPTTEITDAELRNIDQYVMAGGSLGVFGGGMHVALEGELAATPSGSNINTLLEAWGITIRNGIVADVNCQPLPLPGVGFPVPYPPAPAITFTEEQAEHPALFRLTDTTVLFASPISTTDTFRGFGEGAVVLMRSSEMGPNMPGSWLLEGESIDLHIRQGREWVSTIPDPDDAESVGPFPLAVALETSEGGPALPSAFANSETPPELTEATGPVRVLVVGSSSVLRDEFIGDTSRVTDAQLAGAMAFPLNAVDWLSQDADMIAIRAKTIEEPSLEVPQSVRDAEADARTADEAGEEEARDEAIERHNDAIESWESRKSRFRWGNTLFIPIAVGLFGVVRWQMRQRKKASLKI